MDVLTSVYTQPVQYDMHNTPDYPTRDNEWTLSAQLLRDADTEMDRLSRQLKAITAKNNWLTAQLTPTQPPTAQQHSDGITRLHNFHPPFIHFINYTLML